MVPLHLIAFLVLYVASLRLLEVTFVQAGSEAPRELVERSLTQLGEVAEVRNLMPGRRHFFNLVVGANRSIDLQLFDPEGVPLAPVTTMPSQLLGFLQEEAEERFWLDREGAVEKLRGFFRVVSDERCSECHAAGEPLAVVSVATDISRPMVRLRRRMRRNLALLIGAWALVLGVVTITAKKAVARSVQRLEEDLEAAEVGRAGSVKSSDLVLDPVAGRLHRSLRRFLERRREREEEVADRLAHADLLASLGKLAAGMAHEIKNPLAGIQGAIEILQEDAEGGANADLYTQILNELQRVNEILQLMLTTARPSPPRLVELDVAVLSEEVHRLLAPGLRKRKVELALEMSGENLVARLDPAKMRQVLINLVNNASEAMEGGGKVTLRAGRLPAGDGLMLAVADDGPGITEEDQERIFDPFFSTKYAGTGLGLPICRGLVEQHGGTLEVESTPGAGATFLVLLPERVQGAGEESPA